VGAPAYKEWAVIVRALLEGEQILDVRKGGIREDGRHFALQADRFWLYPTAEHQRPELVKPAYRHTLDLAPGSVVGETITIEGWAEVVGVVQFTEPEQLAALDSKWIWTRDYAESRLRWKRRDPLSVLALRAHVLDDAVTVPWDDEYGGCTSWVPLRGLPDDPAELPGRPALSDEAFDARYGFVARDLPDGLTFEAPRVTER
jgi:hypothetical protein